MKLTKQQIDALASKVYQELSAKISKENDILRVKEKEKYKPLYEKTIKHLKENPFISSVYVKLDKSYISGAIKINTSFNEFSNNWTLNKLLESKLKKNILLDDIRRDITIATISSENLQDIENILKKKYK